MADPLDAMPARVRARRDALEMSLSDLSDLSGLAVSTLHAIERGNVANLRVSTLLRLSNALGLAPAALLGRTAARPAVTPAEMELLVCLRRHFTPRDQSETRQ